MTGPIKILYIEALQLDTIAIEGVLKASSLIFEYHRVANKADFERELEEFKPDVILGDIIPGSFNMTAALTMVDRNITHVSFILITDTLSEAMALSLVDRGVDDYIIKDRLGRLPFAVKNAVYKLDFEKQRAGIVTAAINSERRLKAMVENISDAIILVDSSGNIIYSSPSLIAISGYSLPDQTGKSIFDFMHPEDVAAYKDFFYTISPVPGLSVPSIFRLRHKNGGYINTEGSITNLLDDASIGAFIINCRDVTSRKANERQLIKSEADLRAIFDNTNIAYVFVNKENKIISFNHQASLFYERELGINIKAGDDILTYAMPAGHDVTKSRFEAVLEGYKISYEEAFQHEQGTVWYVVNVLPVRDNFNNVLGFIVASEDITRRKTIELEKVHMTSEIIRHNKELEQFTYIVSHNLRAPVASILALTALLRDVNAAKPGDFEKFLDGLTLSATKLDAVIADLNFILQTKLGINEKKEMLSLTVMMADIKVIIGDLIADHNPIITTDFEEYDNIFTIKSYLYSIFINLVQNSIKYSRAGIKTEIFIQARKVPGKVIITFRDNGLGIDLTQHRSKLFGLYKRFHDHVEGKGMGLYLVKTQLEMLGGTISVSSEVNKGTEFLIMLDQ